MAPRRRARYRVITVPDGRVILDRLTKNWTYTTTAGTLVSHGHMQKPDWTAYLPGRVKG